MSEWKELSKLVERKIGYGIVQPGNTGGNVPVIKVNNIINGLVSPKGLETTTEEIASKYERTKLKGGELIISLVGTVGATAIVPKSFAGCNLVRATGMVDIKDLITAKYVKYYLETRNAKEYLYGRLNTTVQPTLNIKTLEKLPIPIINRKMMVDIVTILSSLDDKIAVNRRICENLEAQAQALFKHWFIDFAPFKDGKFVESELGMIPEGWKVGRLSEIADINPTRSLKKGTLATYLDMKNMPTMGSFPSTWEEKEFVGGMKFKNGDTLMARITPCLENGKVAYVNFLKDEEIAFGSTEYIVMTAKENLFPELLYTLCRFPSFVSYATKNMNGSSGRQRVSGETISNFQIVIAPNSVYETVKPLFKDYMKMICKCGFENLRLSTLRDTLLPKLMSGQIKV